MPTQIEQVKKIVERIAELAAAPAKESCFTALVDMPKTSPLENEIAKIGEISEYLKHALRIARMTEDEYAIYAEKADYEAGLVGRA